MAAENDRDYLYDCFVDTGDYDTLVNTRDDRSIILGRTGSGKSALLEIVKRREENIIEIHPEELSLNYISHSNVIKLLEECGVNLDPFYQLLWKHVFAIELIKYKYKITDESSARSTIDQLLNIFRKDKSKEVAVEYLVKWHDKFWLPVEERVKEITSKIEEQLNNKLKVGGGVPKLVNISDEFVVTKNLNKEEKQQIKNRVQSAVDSVQIQELHRVIKLLGEDVFTDEQQKFYVLIDKLDETWVENKTRFKLIRALFNTIVSFRKVRTVKFLLAMRQDLLQTVFNRTRDASFQEDKQRDYMLNLSWSDSELKELLDLRVGSLFQRQYEKKDAKFYDIFSRHVGNQDTLSWILERTMMRPRDVIFFCNLCLEKAVGESSINSAKIKDVEVTYSRERLEAVCQEWKEEYPSLELVVDILKRKKNGFTHSDISREQIEKLASEIFVKEFPTTDDISSWSVDLTNKDISRATYINRLFSIFYKVGIVGIKRDGHESAIWAFIDTPTITETEVKRSSHFYIHPMFWRVLGTHNDTRKQK